jgi:hypothetical protein
MADNFNMKQFLAENKLGPYSKLNENPIYATGEDDDYDARGDAERTGTEFIKLSDPRNPRHSEWMRSKSSGGGNPIDKATAGITRFNRIYIDKYKYKKGPEREAAKAALERAIENRIKDDYRITNKEAAKKAILNKILGPIHAQWSKYKTSTDNTVTENIDNEVPLTDEVKKAIDDQIANDKADGEFENLVDMGFYEEDFPLELIDLFPDEDYDNISQNVRDYIADAISGDSSIKENEVNENLTPIQQQLIQNIVDNWADGGIDAEPAMARIDKILMGDMSDEELEDDGLNEALSYEAIKRIEGLIGIQELFTFKTTVSEIADDLVDNEGFEYSDVRDYLIMTIKEILG